MINKIICIAFAFFSGCSAFASIMLVENGYLGIGLFASRTIFASCLCVSIYFAWRN